VCSLKVDCYISGPSGLPESELSTMSLGLAHSLSRYKLKFSPDKVDTMIVQAICKATLMVFGIFLQNHLMSYKTCQKIHLYREGSS
jgi:hypothetical protein